MISMKKNIVVLESDFNYADRDNIYTIHVNKNYTCRHDLGEYSIACDNYNDDSFIGIYNYIKDDFSEAEIDNIYEFHINQAINYIEEKNYKYDIEEINDIVVISYNNMNVLLKQVNYYSHDKYYSLVVMKEVLSKENNLNEFQNMVDSIQFLV